MTDTEEIINPLHFGSDPADIQILWINPKIWIWIQDHFCLRFCLCQRFALSEHSLVKRETTKPPDSLSVRMASGVMFSSCSFVCPFVCYQTCEDGILKTNYPFPCKFAQMVPWTRTWNDQVLVKGQGHMKLKLDLKPHVGIFDSLEFLPAPPWQTAYGRGIGFWMRIDVIYLRQRRS